LQERLVRFRASTILAVLGIVIAVAVVLEIVWISRRVLAWILIALFLALALNPLVDWLQRRGIRQRGLAIGVTYLLVIAVIVAIGALFIPKLVSELNGFVGALPDYVRDITHHRGRLGFLERKYHVSEHVKDALKNGGTKRLLGLTGTAIAITKGIITAVVATVTIAFMTFFMLLEGPAWMDRFYKLLPEHSRKRWQGIGQDVYRTVGGYVTGNLLISVIAGVSTTLVLLALGVPFAVALGLLVAILDLIPLAGATIAGIILVAVAFLHSIVAGIVVIVFFVVYQQVENHILQPFVYSRTVQLSPLAILIAVLIGAELAGILGALAAIPLAGTIQVLLRAWLEQRRRHPHAAAGTV